MSMLERFKEEDARLAALNQQFIINGNEDAAKAFAEKGEMVEFHPGQNIIEEGDAGREVYFLFTGQGRIIVNKTRLHTRDAGRTIGEMAAMNPLQPRSATIEAENHVIAMKVPHTHFLEVMNRFLPLWPRLTIDIAGRLQERNQYVKRANPKPNIFMICSHEALNTAETIRYGLRYVAETDLWSDEHIFRPGNYPLDDLARQVDKADFGIALAEPDDLLLLKGEPRTVPRDNVVFELGWFMSRLGRNRTLLLVPDREIKLPSDWKGMNQIPYDHTDDLAALPQKLGPTIGQLKMIIQRLGPRASLLETK